MQPSTSVNVHAAVSADPGCISSSFLEMCHININSLRANIDLLRSHLSMHTYDVVALSETWLTDKISNDMVDINDFNLVRRDRYGKRGGGVAIYVKSHLHLRILFSSSELFDNKPEFIIVEISSRHVKPLLFAVVYRRPGGESLDDFEYHFKKFFNLYDNVVICGDFNYNLNGISIESNYIRDFFESFNLFIVPYDSTHHTTNSESWIDLCVVDDKDKLIAVSQSHVPFVAGHELISISYKWTFKQTTCSAKTFRNISGIDDTSFLSTLNSVNWSNLYLSHSIDFKQSFICNAIIKALDEHAPLRTCVMRRNVCPWMNDDIRDMIRQRDSVFRAWKRVGTDSLRNKFKTLRNIVKFSIRKARDEYNAGRLRLITDSGRLWSELRRIGLAKRKMDDSPLNFDVNLINDYFISVCGNSSFNIKPLFLSNFFCDDEFDDTLFFFEDICPSMLMKALRSIKTEAQGYDGLSISAVMKAMPVLFPYVLDLFNLSLQTSTFPDEWKRVLIKPVSKSGYRKGFSTQTLLIKVNDDICKAIDERKVTIIVFFDFSKAFDMVPHTILLTKLKSIGLSCSVLKWFASYLSGRMQAVVGAKGEISEWADIGTGVPQGSVLGPLLFLLFTNELSNVLKYCKHMYFVDDLQIYMHSSLKDLKHNLSLLKEDVQSVLNWAETNILKINLNKTYSMIFGSTWYINNVNECNYPPIEIDNITIPFVDSVRNLGVIYRPTLSWDKQVGKICKNTYASLSQFKANRNALTTEIKIKIVTSLIFPHFDYCCAVYNDLTDELNYKLEKLLNSCIRFIFNLRMDVHVTPYRRKLGWLSYDHPHYDLHHDHHHQDQQCDHHLVHH
ncbi:uncharacterized protein LOC127285557 [Leptopilina boulardi]|uniref:uncharacterized protein LOC127285557 n=1 Tax=Leptopilina boulardi TaxID=63433 RepID=UPI0021F59AC1|nr:uncharacterized protein LOC127285557 [Leptopilina boulardi]